MCCAIVVHKVGEMSGGLGQSASLRFLSPLIERLSDWLHRKARGRQQETDVSRQHSGT